MHGCVRLVFKCTQEACLDTPGYVGYSCGCTQAKPLTAHRGTGVQNTAACRLSVHFEYKLQPNEARNLKRNVLGCTQGGVGLVAC